MMRLVLAMTLEAIWEILENSAMVIDRYHDAGVLGYRGDTILNAVGDLFFCAAGLVLAHYLGLTKSIVLFVVVEVVLLLMIRDNLTLNVIALVHPVEAIKEWQAVMQ
jgi:hypothetical protein